MKKTILAFLFLAIVSLPSCGSLTLEEARKKLNTEAETLSKKACDCINSLTVKGDALIEEVSKCRGEGQSKLMNLSQEEGISAEYPDLLEDAQQIYFEKVMACTK